MYTHTYIYTYIWSTYPLTYAHLFYDVCLRLRKYRLELANFSIRAAELKGLLRHFSKTCGAWLGRQEQKIDVWS